MIRTEKSRPASSAKLAGLVSSVEDKMSSNGNFITPGNLLERIEIQRAAFSDEWIGLVYREDGKMVAVAPWRALALVDSVKNSGFPYNFDETDDSRTWTLDLSPRRI